MKSIFHSHRTVSIDDIEYRIEADVTVRGVPFFRVTNTETDVSEYCTRKNTNQAHLSFYTDGYWPTWFRPALEAADEVEII